MTTGSLSFETFANFLTDSVETLVLLVGVMFILISMLFKVGAFPFHVLICDIYEGALTSTTVFFVVVPKAVTFYIIFKLCYLSFAQHEQILQDLLFAVGTLSIITSAVVALYQKRIKRLLAFSTISHTGFLLLSVGCFSIESIKSLVFYLPIYALMSIVVFYIISLSFSKFGFLKYIIN
jgi:NADH-quinone oxidoreductase subunit N